MHPHAHDCEHTHTHTTVPCMCSSVPLFAEPLPRVNMKQGEALGAPGEQGEIAAPSRMVRAGLDEPRYTKQVSPVAIREEHSRVWGASAKALGHKRASTCSHLSTRRRHGHADVDTHTHKCSVTQRPAQRMQLPVSSSWSQLPLGKLSVKTPKCPASGSPLRARRAGVGIPSPDSRPQEGEPWREKGGQGLRDEEGSKGGPWWGARGTKMKAVALHDGGWRDPGQRGGGLPHGGQPAGTGRMGCPGTPGPQSRPARAPDPTTPTGGSAFPPLPTPASALSGCHCFCHTALTT